MSLASEGLVGSTKKKPDTYNQDLQKQATDLYVKQQVPPNASPLMKLEISIGNVAGPPLVNKALPAAMAALAPIQAGQTPNVAQKILRDASSVGGTIKNDSLAITQGGRDKLNVRRLSDAEFLTTLYANQGEFPTSLDIVDPKNPDQHVDPYQYTVSRLARIRSENPGMYKKFMYATGEMIPLQTFIDINNQTPTPVKIGEKLPIDQAVTALKKALNMNTDLPFPKAADIGTLQRANDPSSYVTKTQAAAKFGAALGLQPGGGRGNFTAFFKTLGIVPEDQYVAD